MVARSIEPAITLIFPSPTSQPKTNPSVDKGPQKEGKRYSEKIRRVYIKQHQQAARNMPRIAPVPPTYACMQKNRPTIPTHPAPTITEPTTQLAAIPVGYDPIIAAKVKRRIAHVPKQQQEETGPTPAKRERMPADQRATARKPEVVHKVMVTNVITIPAPEQQPIISYHKSARETNVTLRSNEDAERQKAREIDRDTIANATDIITIDEYDPLDDLTEQYGPTTQETTQDPFNLDEFLRFRSNEVGSNQDSNRPPTPGKSIYLASISNETTVEPMDVDLTPPQPETPQPDTPAGPPRAGETFPPEVFRVAEGMANKVKGRTRKMKTLITVEGRRYEVIVRPNGSRRISLVPPK